MTQEIPTPRCTCGKTAAEHDYPLQLARHHYWYMHIVPMPECTVCVGREAHMNETLKRFRESKEMEKHGS